MKDERKTMNLPEPSQPLMMTSPLPTCAVASPGLIERGQAILRSRCFAPYPILSFISLFSSTVTKMNYQSLLNQMELLNRNLNRKSSRKQDS